MSNACKRRFTYVSSIVLLCVLLLIAFRSTGRLSLSIWQIMLGGAALVVVTGEITPLRAVQAVNADVMLFLFCMFIVGEAVCRSGFLERFSRMLFVHAGTTGEMVLLLIVSTGFFSALLMNDTLAIIGTPFVIRLARRTGIPAHLLLLALAFSVTTGSAASPIGNPQNLLIALSGGIAAPFPVFAWYLGLPTIVGLVLVYLVLRVRYPGEYARPLIPPADNGEADPALAAVVRVSLALLVVLICARALVPLPLPLIAAAAALPVLIGARDRSGIVRSIDWPTLVFFAALFILMRSVSDSGLLPSLISGWGGITGSSAAIFTLGILASQLISNVPYVALVLSLGAGQGMATASLMALAAGSTLAGNMLVLGAASNVIIIQQAERYGETISFYEFALAGIPLTVLQALVYLAAFLLIPPPPF